MRLRLVLVIWMAVVLPASAQVAVRVRWPLIDFVVRGDSTGALQLLASPNMQTEQRDVVSVSAARLVPDETLNWIAVVRSLVDSAARSAGGAAPGGLGPPLRSESGTTMLALGVAPGASDPPTLLFAYRDMNRPRGWHVEASRDQIQALLNAMGAVTAWVKDHRFEVAPKPPVGSSTCAVWPDELNVDRQPEPLKTRMLRYPQELAPFEGRVWVQVVIDSTGRIGPEGRCVVLSDDPTLTREVLGALSAMRFRPAERAGQPVSVRGVMDFHFTIRWRLLAHTRARLVA